MIRLLGGPVSEAPPLQQRDAQRVSRTPGAMGSRLPLFGGSQEARRSAIFPCEASLGGVRGVSVLPVWFVPAPVVTSPARKPAGGRDARDFDSEQRLLERIHRGSRATVDALFERYRPWLRGWARGPPAGVGARRHRHQRPRPGRAAPHVRAARGTRAAAGQRVAGLPAPRRRQPDSRRAAARRAPSGQHRARRGRAVLGRCGASTSAARR